MSQRDLAESAGISRATLQRRMAQYGITAEQAARLPHNQPAWMVRIEQEEGQSVEQILRGAARCVEYTGYGLEDHAHEWASRAAP